MSNRIAIAILVPALLFAGGSACGSCGGCGGQDQSADRQGHCHWLEVQSVVPGGVAELVGITAGDVIYTYNGVTVGCLADLAAAKSGVDSQDSVDVSVVRGDGKLTFRMPVGQLGVYLKEWENDIVPDEDAVLVEDVPSLDWTSGKMNTFFAALEAFLDHAGEPRGYAFLSGVSGAAFRIHFFDTWCVSSPEPQVGFDNTVAALDAAGYRAMRLAVSTDGKNWPQLLSEIRTSVDAGTPVMAVDIAENSGWGLFTGYQKSGEQLFCRTSMDKRKGYDLADGLPFEIALLERSGDAPGIEQSYRRSFEVVAENLAKEKYGLYYSGLAAFDKWMDRIRTDDFVAMDSWRFAEITAANSWTYNRLIHDRETGIDYLAQVAERLPQFRTTLDSLAALYASEVALLGPVFPELPCPGTCTSGDMWTQESKDRQLAVLTGARKLEEQALVLWQEIAGAK